MSIYSERLAILKKDIVAISNLKKKKRWKNNQKILINFINGETSNAKFIINGQNITLFVGDKNKGFIHILEKHYCSGCPGEITTMDILNITDIVQRGLKLVNEGVTNNSLIVYKKIKGTTNHKLVLKPINNGNLVITMYSIT